MITRGDDLFIKVNGTKVAETLCIIREKEIYVKFLATEYDLTNYLNAINIPHNLEIELYDNTYKKLEMNLKEVIVISKMQDAVKIILKFSK